MAAELSSETQVKLLRVLQEGTLFPVGAERPLTVDVRVIAATNQELKALVAKKRFREDLFFRLNIIELALPPLRARPDDVALLMGFFLERLRHASIVQILDSGEADGTHFLVTEYVPGVNLAEHIRTRQPSISEILRIMGVLSEAIAFAHKNGIVHRDIKPANVLVHGGEVKVLDFGLAQITVAEPGFSTLTRTDLAMGTFNYLSPEQRTNDKGVDARSDVFSLGVVLFEALTGTLPLGSFSPPSALNREVDKRIDKVVERSLRSDPDLRYPSADAFAADLARAGRPSPPWKRPAVRANLAATLVVAGAAAAWGLASPSADDANARQDVVTKEQRSLTVESMCAQQVETQGQAGEALSKNNAVNAETMPMNPSPKQMDNPPPLWSRKHPLHKTQHPKSRLPDQSDPSDQADQSTGSGPNSQTSKR